MPLLSGSLPIAKGAEKLLISVCYRIPAVELAHSLYCCVSISFTLCFRHQERSLHLLSERCLCERDCDAAGNLTVLGCVKKKRKSAPAHGLDQSRMGSSDLRRVYIGEAVGLKLAIPAAINSARKHDSPVASVPDPANVIGCVWRIADQRKLHVSVHAL